ncbi:class I SAM-dependent rRNA methyltransferase [Planctomycetota bacterium]
MFFAPTLMSPSYSVLPYSSPIYPQLRDADQLYGARHGGYAPGSMATVYVKKGRVRPLLYRHPWVYADSIDRVEGEVEPGTVVDVRAPDGRFLARGFYNASSRLCVRSFAFEEGSQPDGAWIRRQIEAAITYRRETLGLGSADTNCYRLVHGDSDLLPGLVVDRFGSILAIQLTTKGLEVRRENILDALEALLAPQAIVECPDMRTRKKEGLGSVEHLQRGELPPEGRVEVLESGISYEVDVVSGQKTGFFCDQRENRALVRRLARGRRVLDGMCFTGGFGLNAAQGDAERVEAVDSSASAIEIARRNAERNGLVLGFHTADLYKLLAGWRQSSRRFDLTVLDPPNYVHTRRDLEKALRKYRELFSLGVSVTTRGGVLVCCTCSGLMQDADLEGVLREIVRTSGREIRVFHRGEQAPDHPVSVTCPESRYLRAYFCHVG